MAEPNWPSHALRMGWFGFRRSLRALREDTGRLVLLVAAVLFPTLVFGAMTALFAPALRESFPTGHAVPPMVRGSTALFWLFGVFILAQRTATVHDELVAEAFVLTTVSTRRAVLGGIVAESLRVLAYVVAPGLLLTVVAAYAAASPAPVVFVPLVACLFVASAVTTGRLLGYSAAWLVARIPFVARHRTALSAAVAIIFFGGYMLFQLPMLPVSLDPAILGLLPIGWLVGALAIGTPVAWSLPHAVAGVITAVGLIALCSVAATRVAASLWYGERLDPSGANPVHPVGDELPLSAALGPISVPNWIGSGPVQTVARWALLRARREPQRLNFLLVPAFGGGSALLNLYLQGSVSRTVLGPATSLLLGWTAGAAFALNPLGDEGPVLPSTLTAVSGREFVRGLVAPPLLTLPVVAVVTLMASMFGGTPLSTAAAYALIGAFLAAIGGALAPAIGIWFPRYSAIRIGNSDDIRPPRLVAGTVHTVLIWIPGAALVGVIAAPEIARLVASGIGSVPAVLLGFIAGDGPLRALATWFEGVGATIRTLPLLAVQAGLGALLVTGGLLAAWTAYREAVRRFDAHEPYR